MLILTALRSSYVIARSPLSLLRASRWRQIKTVQKLLSGFTVEPAPLTKMSAKVSLNVLENSTPVTKPACLEAFSALEKQEKQYLHFLSQASWYGSGICLFQCSLEAPAIFAILDNHFRAGPDAFTAPAGVSQEDFRAFLVYSAGFYANMGNYKGFGDSKFVPGCSAETFEAILQSGKSFNNVKDLYDQVKLKIFSLEDNELLLGLGGSEGVTSYFSKNCTRPDAEKADKFMQENKVCAENTRLLKSEDGSTYTVLLASEETSEEPILKKDFDGSVFEVRKGDYSQLLKRVNYYLQQALKYASNDHEKAMITDYIESFRTGSLEKHKDGSRHWIKNKGPIVECYIGFIETYRDPFGTRAEFEGFVAVVNKPMSAKFGTLVENAEHLLPHLPWPKEFEKDTFLRPDFTSLDILCYGASGVPAGINIPNYDEIRFELLLSFNASHLFVQSNAF